MFPEGNRGVDGGEEESGSMSEESKGCEVEFMAGNRDGRCEGKGSELERRKATQLFELATASIYGPTSPKTVFQKCSIRSSDTLSQSDVDKPARLFSLA